MLSSTFDQGRILIPYFTFGDPHVAFTEALIEAAIRGGADIIELGMPFSDPIADGPVIQSSHQRALLADPNISFTTLFKMVKKIKQVHKVPFVVMTDVNLVLQFGPEPFFLGAASHGIDGTIIPNLPVEESGEFVKLAKKHGVNLIQLLSPLCPRDRMKKVVQASQGFLYLISTTGTTGERDKVASGLAEIVDQIRHIKQSIPIAVGFGISKPSQAQEVWRYADGVIVGSYWVRLVETHLADMAAACKAVYEGMLAFKKS